MIHCQFVDGNSKITPKFIIYHCYCKLWYENVNTCINGIVWFLYYIQLFIKDTIKVLYFYNIFTICICLTLDLPH